MEIPGNALVYKPAELNFSPEGKTYDVTSVEDAYTQLLESTFVIYGNNISNHFGINTSE